MSQSNGYTTYRTINIALISTKPRTWCVCIFWSLRRIGVIHFKRSAIRDYSDSLIFDSLPSNQYQPNVTSNKMNDWHLLNMTKRMEISIQMLLMQLLKKNQYHCNHY